MNLEKEVRDKIAELLEVLLVDPTDPGTFKRVLDKLTRMAILGTLPAGSRPRPVVAGAEKTESNVSSMDFSEEKERFIAP